MELEIEKSVEDFAIRAQSLTVTDQQSLILANDIGLAGKRLIEKIKTYWKPFKDDVKAALDRLKEEEARWLLRVEPIVEHVGAEAARYLAEEKRKRLEAEAAARRAEEERKRLEEEVIRKALEQEAIARQEQEAAERIARKAEARAAAEQNATARKKAEEEAARIRRDAELLKRESEQKAKEETDRIITEAAAQEKTFESVIAPPEKIKLQGQTHRDNWSAKVFDLAAFMAGVQAGLVPIDAIEPRMPWLNEQARKHHDKLSFPGVRAVNNPTMMRTK